MKRIIERFFNWLEVWPNGILVFAIGTLSTAVVLLGLLAHEQKQQLDKAANFVHQLHLQVSFDGTNYTPLSIPTETK